MMSDKNCIAEIAVNKPRLINRPFWLLSELDGYYAILMVLNCNLTTKLTYRDEAHRTSGRVVSPERSRRACPASCGGSALSGFVVMFHSDDYIPLLVPCFDIPVSLGSLFQRIASIYDRFYLSRLNKLFEEE